MVSFSGVSLAELQLAPGLVASGAVLPLGRLTVVLSVFSGIVTGLLPWHIDLCAAKS